MLKLTHIFLSIFFQECMYLMFTKSRQIDTHTTLTVAMLRSVKTGARSDGPTSYMAASRIWSAAQALMARKWSVSRVSISMAVCHDRAPSHAIYLLPRYHPVDPTLRSGVVSYSHSRVSPSCGQKMFVQTMCCVRGMPSPSACVQLRAT